MRKFMSKQDKHEMAIKLAKNVNTDIHTAFGYLEAEEWSLFDAAASIRADRKAGLQND